VQAATGFLPSAWLGLVQRHLGRLGQLLVMALMATCWATLLAAATTTAPAWGQALQAIPPLSARVTDTTGTLQTAERAQLEAKLQAFEQARGTQIAVLMVATTQPEDIVDYTQRVADAWKLGRRDVGDGVLLVVAKGDRTLRIATAKTLEGAVPDLAARRVIEEAITPRFRQGDFAGGISAGLDQLFLLVSGERLPEPPPGPRAGRAGTDWNGLLVFLFVAVPVAARLLSAMLGRKWGSVLTGGAVGVLAWGLSASVVLGLFAALVGAVFALASAGARTGFGSGTGGWGGHSSGGRFGGGGFRSGGGGNFGGGGASGRW
jgi:uncharacterized protein